MTEKQISEIHLGNRSKLSYRLAWARNYLKRFGVLDNSQRGVWSLNAEGLKVTTLDKDEVKKYVLVLDKKERKKKEISGDLFEDKAPDSWEDGLLNLIKSISPASFERLGQRLLRESGFIHV